MCHYTITTMESNKIFIKLIILYILVTIVTTHGPEVSVPYIDITAKDGPKLAQIAQKTGQKFFTLAFVLGSNNGCDPKWGGIIDLNDTNIINQVRELQAMGGGVMVATGGAMGPYLEGLCNTDQLANAYIKIMDTVGTSHLDIDVEASVPIDTMNRALAKVQRTRPGTTISFTLMIQGDDYGLTPQLGVDLLKNAVKNGVYVDVVNAMTMEFGSSKPSWGDAVISAAESVLKQMKEIWPDSSDHELKKKLGVTPMIGRNFNSKVFDLSHARQLVSWAQHNRIGMLGFWSVGRDNGRCPGGGVSATCSSVAQEEYEFTRIFNKFKP